MIAPFAVTGNFSGPDERLGSFKYNIENVTGTMTPDVLELHCHRGWFTVLILTSLIMLCAAIAAVVLGLMRTRKNILDRVSVLLKNSPYVEATYRNSVRSEMEKTRLKDVRLSLRDIPPKMQGYSPVNSTDDGRNSPRVDSSH